MVNIAATFAGAAVLFFLLNRFFGLDPNVAEKLEEIRVEFHQREKLLLENIEQSKLLSDETVKKHVNELSKSYEKIRNLEFQPYVRIANDTMRDCLERLTEISSGTVVFPSRSAYDYTDEGIRTAKYSIRATSLDSEFTYWSTASGRKYLATNQDAIKRGVKVTRIFAIEDQKAASNVSLLKEHEKAGVATYIGNPIRVTCEWLIFDDRILVEYEFDSKQQQRIERIVLDPVKVNRAVEEFENWRSRSKTIKELPMPKK